MPTPPRPIALIILDGWGYSEDTQLNAIASANTPTFDQLFATYPHTFLFASSCNVGLPEGQMGNSEVGHLNLGAGRVVFQDLSRVTNAIEDGSFFNNPALAQAVDAAVNKQKAVHIFGLLSPGGIHSHEHHIHAMIRLAAQRGAQHIYFHAFLDGRDTPPKSATQYIETVDALFYEIGHGKIATLTGRFYAMDRDNRWDRVEQAYNLLTLGEAAHHAPTALDGLKLAYDAGETDEFVKPTSIHNKDEPPVTINDGDSIIFMNYRADRAREITRTFIEEDFHEFNRKRVVQLSDYVGLAQYDATFDMPIAFSPEKLTNTLGEYLAKQHKKQLRIAETEKYAHVTFFLNGGIEAPNEGEDRILIPSPKVATYDLQPDMNADKVTEKLVEAINSNTYDVIICNFANPDMIGHTGNFDATVTAITHLDHCLKQVIDALQKVNGEAIITADHGNAEQMFDPATGQPHTAHTCNVVPFIYVGRPATLIHQTPSLCDIAPTLLSLMNLPIPKEMTGHPIVQVTE